MSGTCADHGPAGSGMSAPVRRRSRASMTAATSRAPVRSRSAIAAASTAGVQAGEFGGAHRPPQPFRLVAGLLPVSRRQAPRAGPVPLLAGGAVSAVQMACRMARWSALARACCRSWVADSCWPSRSSTSDSTASASRAGPAGWPGREGRPGRREPVVAGQLGGRARARRRVGELGGQGEHVGDVGVGAAGQGDVGVLAVLGAGDHRQAGVHGAALRGVVGDRIAQFGIS